VLLGGVAGATPTPSQIKENPAIVRGVLAALDDPDNAVVAKALGLLSKEKAYNTPQTQKRLQSLIREPRFIDLLKDPDENVRLAAEGALGSTGEAANDLVPRLLELLKDPNANVRHAAVKVLGAMGETARQQAPRFGDLLKDPDPTVRRAAAGALGTLGEDAKEQAPRLIDLLKDPDWNARRAAAGALGAMGEAAKEQAPRLGDLLKDPDPDVRAATAEALEAMGKAAKEQAPRLGDLLKDPDPDVRHAAAGALGAMGEAAKEQAPRLGDLLKDPNWSVRHAAARALGKISEAAKEQAPLLIDLLNDPDSDVRFAAADALGAIKAQVPRLVDLLRHPDEDVRYVTSRALEQMGEAAKEQAPRLADLLKDPDPDVRRAAAGALGAMGEAARQQAPLLIDLLKDPDSDVRYAAASALGRMGEAAKEQAPRLVDLLKDPDPYFRRAATGALEQMGEAAKEQAPRLVDLLKDPDPDVRRAAARALGAMGEAARQQAPRLADLLKDPDPYVRRAAAEALWSMGKAAKDQAPRLVDLLKDPDENVRYAASRALEKMGEAAKDQAPRLVDLLKDPDWNVRYAAAEALGAMGEAAKEQAPRLADLLKDLDWNVRRAAARALGTMGEAAKQQAPHLSDLLKDPDFEARLNAAWALMAMGKAVKEHTPRLVDLLKNPDPDVRRMAVEVLGAMGEAAKEQAPFVAELLKDKDEKVRTASGEALTAMAPLDPQHIAAILAMAGTDPGHRREWLLGAHMAGGGAPQVERILRWLQGRTSSEVPKELTLDEARETLRAFAELWPHTEKHPFLRDDLARQIAHVANLASGQWTSTDIALLESHEKNLEKPYPVQAENLRSAINTIGRWQPLKTFAWTWAGHILFWALLLFAYPRSPQVQAVFFWNPWVRTITGFGYVGLLLTWVPFLRRRLLAPFKDQLLADADLERFPAESYFPDSEVVIQPSGKRETLLVALPRLRGQVVLEGASGLGKSMFIKYLLRHSKPLAVFLPAERCKDGVLEAIQAKLEGHAKDAAFLQSIIYSGALDIYIDGLNEVTADTRARIVQFVERNFHGNILLATQRMEWTPPTTARLYALQPLSDARITQFLLSREPLLGEKARLRGAEYREACERFMQRALSSEQPEELRQAMREVLSNPMDLTVIAQMLAEGHSPDLFRLRQQQYELMARDYLEVNLAEFPLKELAEESYKMRLEDRPSLPEDRFGKELLRLEVFKMVVRRQWKGPDGQEHREWRFRHDKLQEYFIAQTFLGADNPRIVEHMDDPRFRGVYFLLALLLEPESARHLRDLLVVRAAKTRDHTVSDEFVTLLEARRGAEQAQLARPKAPAATGT
jgi:HEAT repeat protein